MTSLHDMIADWIQEYVDITGDNNSLTEPCRKFLARRIHESVNPVESDPQNEPDVVRFRTTVGWKSWRIVRMHANDMVYTTSTDDMPSMMIQPMADIHPHDIQKAKDWLWGIAN